MNDVLLRLAALTSQRALMIGAVVTGAWYFLLFDDGSAIQTKLAGLNAQVQTEKAKEQESDAALKEISAVQASLGALSDQFKLVSAQLPTDIQMAEIIRTVDKISQATSLLVKIKEPKTSTMKDVVEVLPLHIAAEGSFSEITMFFYYLSTIERIVSIQNFVITAPQDLKKSSKLTLDADVASYKFLPAIAKKNMDDAGKPKTP